MNQALGLKFHREWGHWIKVCFIINNLLDVSQVGNFLVYHTSVPHLGINHVMGSIVRQESPHHPGAYHLY